MIDRILQEKFKNCDYTYAFKSCNSEPKRVGEQFLESNINKIKSTLESILQATDIEAEKFVEIEKFIDDYKIKMDRCASISSRIASPLVQGRANFPFAKMERLMDSHRKVAQELEMFVANFKAKMIKKYKIEDSTDIIDKLIADYYKSIALGSTKQLASSSLKGKLITQAKKGYAKQVAEAISDYKIFTKRNNIHKTIEKLIK